ncbi:hypothetical protein EDB19DRAFT_1973802 [Suillus lakei]|nr:hypothetical protein EDB19DRAFT_1973802 [Suillus lakei]
MPPPKSKGGKMLGLINWRLKVTINDGRALTGQMLAFDRHMNLSSDAFGLKKNHGETETPAEQEMKRTLGLVILRGETVVSLSVEGPPPVVDEDKKNALPVGPGRGMPAGRGMGMMPPMGMPPMGRPPMPFAPPGMPWPPSWLPSSWLPSSFQPPPQRDPERRGESRASSFAGMFVRSQHVSPRPLNSERMYNFLKVIRVKMC